MSDEEIAELINRRRRQILVHSAIYYRFNDNIIDDHTYDMWSKELAELQSWYPDIAKKCVYAKEYTDFDGSTGFHLPIHNPEIVASAQRLLNYHKRRQANEY